jgi:hypothetical protein
MLSTKDDSLLQYTSTGYKQFHLKSTRRRSKYLTYSSSYIDIFPNTTTLESYVNVDVTHRSSDIQVLCTSDINSHGNTSLTEERLDLQSLYINLLESIKRLCGEVQLPPDGGKALIQHLTSTAKPLLGVSDASLKDGQSGHAWILSTGDTDHLDNPLMKLSGQGAVDGYHTDMSSA